MLDTRLFDRKDMLLTLSPCMLLLDVQIYDLIPEGAEGDQIVDLYVK